MVESWKYYVRLYNYKRNDTDFTHMKFLDVTIKKKQKVD